LFAGKFTIFGIHVDKETVHHKWQHGHKAEIQPRIGSQFVPAGSTSIAFVHLKANNAPSTATKSKQSTNSLTLDPLGQTPQLLQVPLSSSERPQ